MATPRSGVENAFFVRMADVAEITIHFVAANHALVALTSLRSGERRCDCIGPRFGRARASIPRGTLFRAPAIRAAGFEDALVSSKMPSNRRRCPENCASKSSGIFEDARSGLIAFGPTEPRIGARVSRNWATIGIRFFTDAHAPNEHSVSSRKPKNFRFAMAISQAGLVRVHERSHAHRSPRRRHYLSIPKNRQTDCEMRSFKAMLPRSWVLPH